ncbi:MAG: hypothetical protein K6F63_08835 [Lachnospiraceae bacterium]|nr:hypothetical protein [Lachnospiraceae bacterium]
MDYEKYFRIQIANATNTFIYMLRSIPLIGKLIPQSLYGKYDMKKWLSWGGLLVTVIKNLLRSSLVPIIFIYYAPRIALSEEELHEGTFLGLFILLNVVASALNGSSIFRCSKEDYMFIHHFMVDPTRYYKYKTLKENVIDDVFIIFGIYYIFRDIPTAVALTLLRIASRLLTNVLYLEMFKRKNHIIHKRVRMWTNLACIGIAYALCFTKVLSRISYNNILIIVLFVLSVPVVVFCICYQNSYELYDKMAIKYTDKGFVTITVGGSADLNEGDSILKSITPEEGKAYFEANKQKSPIEYLNSTFRKRYRKLFRDSVINNFVLEGVIAVILGLCIRTGWINVNAGNIFEYTPILISVCLSMSMAATFSSYYFRSIDIYMLQFKLYNKLTVRSIMISRYMRTLLMDLVILVCIAVYVVVFLLTSGIRLPADDFLKFILVCPPILIINDTYQWLMYYYVQPYTKSITIKNPVCIITNNLSQALGLLFLFIRGNILTHLPLIALITAAFVAVYLISSNFAHKFFKIRY